MSNTQTPFTNRLNLTIQDLPNQSAYRLGSWIPRGNSTTIDTIGMLPPTAVGTATARNWANTSTLTRTKRLGYVSASGSTGQLTEAYGAGLQFCGGTATDGGIIFQTIFAITDGTAVTGARFFAGMAGTASALTNAEPTALTNCIGVAQIAADTNMRLIWNDGSGTASSIDLGANFPMTDGNIYEFGFVWQPGATTVQWSVYKVNGDVAGAAENTFFASGELTADLPALTQGLAPHVFRTNNAQTAAVAFDLAVLNVGSYL
jgi:hypothetical protein